MSLSDAHATTRDAARALTLYPCVPDAPADSELVLANSDAIFLA